MLNSVAQSSQQTGLYTLGVSGFRGPTVARGYGRFFPGTWDRPVSHSGSWLLPPGLKQHRRGELRLGRVLSYGQQHLVSMAGRLFLPPSGSLFDEGIVSVYALGVSYEAPVAYDLGCRVVGVPGPMALPSPNACFAFAVLPVSVPTARAGLTGARL